MTQLRTTDGGEFLSVRTNASAPSDTSGGNGRPIRYSTPTSVQMHGRSGLEAMQLALDARRAEVARQEQDAALTAAGQSPNVGFHGPIHRDSVMRDMVDHAAQVNANRERFEGGGTDGGDWRATARNAMGSPTGDLSNPATTVDIGGIRSSLGALVAAGLMIRDESGYRMVGEAAMPAAMQSAPAGAAETAQESPPPSSQESPQEQSSSPYETNAEVKDAMGVALDGLPATAVDHINTMAINVALSGDDADAVALQLSHLAGISTEDAANRVKHAVAAHEQAIIDSFGVSEEQFSDVAAWLQSRPSVTREAIVQAVTTGNTAGYKQLAADFKAGKPPGYGTAGKSLAAVPADGFRPTGQTTRVIAGPGGGVSQPGGRYQHVDSGGLVTVMGVQMRVEQAKALGLV
ncbi:MAG: hypothetical protein AB7U38_14195 [Hyphomicrobiales bacterium]